MFFWNVIGYRMHPQFPPAIHSDVFGPRVDFFSILSIFVLYLYNNKWPNFWCFEVFISAKCIYRIYLAFLYFILSKKKIFAIYIFCFFWPYYKYPRILVYFSLEKCSQNLKILLQIWIFLLWDVFVQLLGLYLDKFHYNSVRSKGTAIFCYIK